METENTPDIHGEFDVTDVDAEIKMEKEKAKEAEEKAEEKEWEKQIRTTKERLAQEEIKASAKPAFPDGTLEHELSDEDLLEVEEDKN